MAKLELTLHKMRYLLVMAKQAIASTENTDSPEMRKYKRDILDNITKSIALAELNGDNND